ncbi:alpha/beta hydrolase [Streptantibioticus silvisoli]|uniref:Alpha/beta hydrolase n=1 Tax=Streptantibioticus silvisoli TaxID=2705255 RepID=A0ABT6WAD7_9ACTN|nr:alpha/beta hydrolase [Streptantibioticus silvisoli]MDI5967352.1 alpha/beta hydrolase [Streptantibioticus silvisoli]
MVTRQELEDLDLGTVRTVTDGWGDLMTAAHAAGDDVDRSVMRKVTSTQQGATANALTGRLSTLRDNYGYVSEESGLIQDTMAALVDELDAAQRSLKQAYETAEHLAGFRVEQDGSVSFPLDPPDAGVRPTPSRHDADGSSPADDEPAPPGRGRISGPSAPRSTAPGSPATVTGSGSPATAPGSPASASATAPGDVDGPNRRTAQGIYDTIDAAVRRATAADEKFAGLLRKFTAQHDYAVTGATWRDVAGDDRAAVAADGGDLRLDAIPPAKTDPLKAAEWWKGLTPAQQQEYLALAPDRIGRLDGLPAQVRDEANRVCLPMLIAKYQAGGDRNDEFGKLSGFTAIQARLNNEMGGAVPVYLLDVGDEGQGRATISFGDPDTARNVSAFVPGTGTRLSDLAGGDLQRAKNVWMAANKADPTQSLASVVTLDYDAPQVNTTDILNDPAVMGTGRADQGAVNYDHLLGGIRAAHQGSAPHVTAIGHSYGTLVVGKAATRPGGIPADDMVLVGSPGVGVQHASQLGIGAKHVYVGAADDDPITRLPSKLEGASILRTPVDLLTGNIPGAGADVGTAVGAYLTHPHQLWFGQDPASSGFGAQRFAVAPQGDVFTAQAHSHNYLEAEPMSQKSLGNIGKIVTGHGDQITRQAYR